jgi:serine/threonine-protein kinase HipA
LKVQIGHLQNGLDLSNSVENEYLCLKLTKQFGLPSAHVEIHDFGGQRVLAVERFDRFWTDDRLLRVPQEDCCQALSLPPTLKYEADGGPGLENILRLLRDSDTPFADQRSFLAANVLFWLLGATDGHAKNFSVALGAGGRYSLTPLYDVISAQPSLDDHRMRRKSFRLAMAVGDNKHYVVDEILPRHFEQSARNAGVGKDVVHSIFSELSRTADTAFNEVSHTLPEQFPHKLFDSVFEGAKRRLELLR